MRRIYKRTLIVIAILLVGCGFIGVSYLFYDKVLSDETSVDVVDELSINYIDGILISKNGKYKFTITNSSNKDIYYVISYDELKHYNEKVRYDLTTTDSSVNVNNGSINKDESVLVNNVLIKAGVTQEFTLNILNNSNTSFKLKINRVNNSDNYFYTNILTNNDIKDKSLTKVGSEIATKNEGLIEDVDDTGTSYYFRGNVTNNYVDFAGFTWRIVKINGNGTVKLVLDKLSPELSNYNANFKSYENYNKTNIRQSLSNFYDLNLKSYDAIISNSNYCIETGNKMNGSNKVYNAFTRIVTDKIPTLNCLGNGYNAKIGLLTADEVVYAGGLPDKENKSYYLYNKNINNVWWTVSLSTTKNNEFYPFVVDTEGKIVNNVSGSLYRGLRPSINIVKKVVSEGKGTVNDPYKLKVSNSKV